MSILFTLSTKFNYNEPLCSVSSLFPTAWHEGSLGCLFWVSIWIVPHVWFRFFISTSTLRHQVFFSLPLLGVPSVVHWAV